LVDSISSRGVRKNACWLECCGLQDHLKQAVHNVSQKNPGFVGAVIVELIDNQCDDDCQQDDDQQFLGPGHGTMAP